MDILVTMNVMKQ